MIDCVASVLFLRHHLLEPENKPTTNNHNNYATGNNYIDPENMYARVHLLDNGQQKQNFGEVTSPCDIENNDVQATIPEFRLPSNIVDDIHAVREALDQFKEKRAKAEMKEKCLREWKVICCVTDRLFFIMYLLINIIGIIVIFYGQVV